MNFYEILMHIREIEGLRDSASKEKASFALLEAMKKTGLEGSVELVQKILNPLSAAAAVMPGIELPAHLVEYATHVNEPRVQELYQKLLPYARLAYQFENNGIAEEHAIKLAMMFENEKDVFNYLNTFAKQEGVDKKEGRLMHDALLFSLPPPSCDFRKWRNLAKNNLDNKEFRKLLATADVLEKMIKSDVKRNPTKEEKEERRLKDIEIKKSNKELSEKIIEFKKLKRKHSELSEQEEKRHDTLIREISEWRVNLSKLYAGLPWGQVSYEMLRCYYERYTVESAVAYKYFLDHGLTEKSFEKFCSLDRHQAGANIPDISIDGADYGFPGFYLKKVNVQDDLEAARAACIGKLTDCCQSLSGEAGEPCTIHGLTSPNGGFYMLLKGDIKDPQLEDEVCGATWAWRSKEGNIVFDSVEMNIDSIASNQMLQTFFTILAQEIVDQGESEAVCCGTSSGVSHLFGYAIGIFRTKLQAFSDYDGYCDSQEQYLVAHKAYPFLSVMNISKESQEAVSKEINAFISKYIREGNIVLLKQFAEFYYGVGSRIFVNCD